MANVDTLDLWAKWMGAVQNQALSGGLGGGQRFSAGSTTLNVDLGNVDPTIVNYYIHGLGDVVPANSPSYSPAGGLLTSYAVFLDCIDLGAIPNPNLASQVNLATSALNTAQTAFNNVTTQAIQQYVNYKAINSPPFVPFSTWVVQSYPSYVTANNNLIGAANALDSLMVQAYGAGYVPLQQARSKVGINGAQSLTAQNPFNMAVTSGSIAAPGSQPVVVGGTTPPPASALVSSFAPSYTLQGFSTAYAAWQAASVAGQVGASISVSSSTASYSFSQSGWSASANASLFGDFFNFTASGSASGQKTSIDTSSSDFSLTVDFTGLGSFIIAPGAWWDNGSLVNTFQNKLKPGSPAFFGENGSLAAVPTQLVVGFEPTVKLKMKASDYSNVKSSWQSQATASIGIGPFRIGSATTSAYGSKQDIRWDDASATVTIGPIHSSLPILLGVVSQQLGQ
ncbi:MULTISPECIES: hypothetical protein [unclassified Pseudomonas]|jgi:hypothetical protein|uniref:hypothetical protein n=1 Tax=unclassified Pseudomonas TaxID=196821 RepID=UPI001CFBEBFC|nr:MULTISPECIES: hypothetical protein [unclassified Pseudomonas]WLH78448.1 hypothetical protein PSH81_22400 [Pseudomonas sp. FP2335]